MKIFFVTILALLAIEKDLFAAEAGMPQLDPEYWASQGFWLIVIFTTLYLLISKIFIPKIKNNLDERDNKIREDLNSAKDLKDLADKKLKEYEVLISNGKKEVQKILIESKNNLTQDINNKKKAFDKEIDEELNKAKKEISILKNNSITDVDKISQEIASRIIEEISGDKLNASSIEATIAETSKNKINKYL
jgi:F-type H+-transporting ATPase subunit b